VLVFLIFLSGFLATACFSRQQKPLRSLLLIVVGASAVTFTFVSDLGPRRTLASLAAALAVRSCGRDLTGWFAPGQADDAGDG
jgi:hypothetical protein